MHVFESITDAITVKDKFAFPLLVVIHSKINEPKDSNLASSTQQSEREPKSLASNTNEHKNNTNDDTTTQVDATVSKRAEIDPVTEFEKSLSTNKLIDYMFQLSTIKDGAKQKAVLQKILSVSHLNEVVLLHFIEQGSADYNFFTSVNTVAKDSFPRIYLFTPKTALPSGAAPSNLMSLPVLYNQLLTPATLYIHIASALQLRTMEYSRSFVSQAQLSVKPMVPNALFRSITDKLKIDVEAMNDEARRQAAVLRRQQDNQFVQSIQQHPPHSAPSPLSATTSASSSSQEAKSVNKITTQNKPMQQKSNIHILHILGLPFGKKKAIVINASMTMSTVWNLVKKELVQAEEIIRDAKANGEWDGVHDIKSNASETFLLHIVENGSDNNADDEKRLRDSGKYHLSNVNEENLEDGQIVRSAQRASEMSLSALPANVHVEVSYAGAVHATVKTEGAETNTATEPHESYTRSLNNSCEEVDNAANVKSVDRSIAATSSNASATNLASEMEEKDCIAHSPKESGCKEAYSTLPLDSECNKNNDNDSTTVFNEQKNKAVLHNDDDDDDDDNNNVDTANDNVKLKAEKESSIDNNNSSTSCTTSATEGAPTSMIITVKCTLPDSRSKVIEHLDSTVDSIAQKIRPVIAEMLNHNHFVFVQSYPPKRLSVDVDELKPLTELGMRGPSVLRVVLTSLANNPQPSSKASSLTSSSSNRENKGSVLRDLLSRVMHTSSQPVSASTTGSNNNTTSEHTPLHVDPMANANTSNYGNNNNNNNNSNPLSGSKEKLNASLFNQLLSFMSNNEQATNSQSGNTESMNRTGNNNLSSGMFSFGNQLPLSHQLPNRGRSLGGARRSTGGFASMAEIVDANDNEEEGNAKAELQREEMLRILQSQFREQFQLNNNHENDNNNNKNGEGRLNNNNRNNNDRLQNKVSKHSSSAKKSNRYYGGNSTEFISPNNNSDSDNSDHDEEEEEEEDDEEHENETTQFPGVGHRITDVQNANDEKNNTSATEDGKENEKHTETENENTQN